LFLIILFIALFGINYKLDNTYPVNGLVLFLVNQLEIAYF